MNRLLPLLLLVFSIPVLAESGSYRVEVIIFRNLQAAIESKETQELRSFSEFPDPGKTGQAEPSPEDTAEITRDDLPDDLGLVTQKSDMMNNTWRRLRSSQNYRPLLYTAWDQNRVDYNPPVRVHNEQIIDTQLRPPTPVMVADLAAEDPLAAYRSTFYQLDGSLQLRRSRFLHLFLDLELREEKATAPIDTELLGNAETRVDTYNGVMDKIPGETNEAGLYDVYTLKQNRQINTGRMQYFDTPYFGALVYVSSLTVEN